MAKVEIGAVPYVYPVPIVLIGAMVDGRANYATVGDCAIMGIRPALVAISLSEGHFTTRGVVATGAFSINIPSTDQLALVDHFGIVSGADVDKSALVEFEPGTLDVPLLVSCPVNLECRVVDECAVEHRHIFIASVEMAHVDEAFVSEVDGHRQIAPLTELDPILYALDNRYYSIGGAIGTGYQEGAKFASKA